MTRAPLDHSMSELEPFFAAEREIVAEPEDLRNRVIERAWASVQRNPSLPRSECESRPRRVKIGLAAAAAVVLSAVCAVAFLAGYQARSRSHDAPNNVPAVAPSVIVHQVPAPSIVVAIVPVTPANLVATSAEPVSAIPRPDKVNSAGPDKTAIDIEAYTKELRVLQPARQAVARGDFGSALAAIADHQSQYPSGKLAEEREALRVKALLGLGRTAEARRAGASFLARFPRSALRGRIEEMLGTQK